MSKNYIIQLRQILAAESISQQELARRIGVSFATLNRWLNGHAVPHKRKIDLIDRIHRKSLDYALFTKDDAAQVVKEASEFKDARIWRAITGRQNLQDDLLLEHTYNSTSIEGTTFTKKETEAVIFDKLTIRDKSLIEHLDVINYSVVLRKIFTGEFPREITEDLIKEIHRLLMQGVREDGGIYSQHQRGIRGIDIMLTHPKDIPEEMVHLIREWNATKKKNIHSIAKFHSDFELIHPFGDGNGRVGRLIMVLQCKSQKYAPVIIENARKAEYYEVLEYAQRKSEYPFVRFLLEEMKRTYRIIRKYVGD